MMNHATRVIAAAMGVILAIGGMSHGLFEVLQGNAPTGGVIIDAIGEPMQTWTYGGETAFTLIPNFLITGIAVLGVGLAIIIWSVGFLQTRHGATVLLLLFVILFLVGGGIGQVIFWPVLWAFSTRINKPLTWWRKVLPESVRDTLAGVWPWTLVAAGLLFLVALEIAIFGYFPGVDDAEQLINIVFASLLVSLGLFVLTFVAGFAYDLRQHAAKSRRIPAMSA